jgi:transposase
LARFLRRHDVTVLEVARPPRKGQRRLQGKSDPVDAEHAARQVLAGAGAVTAKTGEGAVEAIRLLKVARDTAVTAHSQAMITLKATLVTASDALRAELEPRTDFALVTACAALEVCGDLADPEVAMRHALRALACRWLALHKEIKAHTRHLKRLTTRTAPELVATFGIGFDCAAELLCAAGDNAGRVRSEAAYAKLCGACPIPAPPARPAVTASTGAATARPTPRCSGSSWSGCAGTLRPSPTCSAAPLRPVQTRDHRLPQALCRPRGLPAPPSPRDRVRRTTPGRIDPLDDL